MNCDNYTTPLSQITTQTVKEYVEDCIKPLNYYASSVLAVSDYLSKLVDLSLAEIKAKDPNLLPFFLGGIKEDGSYSDNSLAKLVYLEFGYFIDPIKLSTLLKTDKDPYPELRISKRQEQIISLSYLENIVKYTDLLLTKAGVQKTPPTLDAFTQNYKLLINFIVKILPMYNWISSLVYTTRFLGEALFKVQYPELYSDSQLLQYLGIARITLPVLGESRNKFPFYIHNLNSLFDLIFNVMYYSYRYFTNSFAKLLLNVSLLNQHVKEYTKGISIPPMGITLSVYKDFTVSSNILQGSRMDIADFLSNDKVNETLLFLGPRKIDVTVYDQYNEIRLTDTMFS